MTSVLEVDDLSIHYNSRQHLAVDKISFDVKEGEVLGIIGPNGAGKTTLFRAILGLQEYSGKIKLFGFEGSKYRSLLPLIGYVPQKVTFEPNFPATVYDVVSMGIISDKKIVNGANLIQQCGCCWNRIYKEFGSNKDKVTHSVKDSWTRKTEE